MYWNKGARATPRWGGAIVRQRGAERDRGQGVRQRAQGTQECARQVEVWVVVQEGVRDLSRPCMPHPQLLYTSNFRLVRMLAMLLARKAAPVTMCSAHACADAGKLLPGLPLPPPLSFPAAPRGHSATHRGMSRAVSHMAQFQMKGSVPKRADTSGTWGHADRGGAWREAPGHGQWNWRHVPWDGGSRFPKRAGTSGT